MIELLLVLLYSSIFVLIITRASFFQLDGIHKRWLITAFVLKLIAGYILYLIYTYYYTDRSTADIFKFFDDSKVMFDALLSKPVDYFRMMTGIGNDTPYFDQYYHKMNNWCSIYPSNIYGDGHLLIRLNALFRLLSLGYYNVHAVFMSFLSFTGLIAMFKVLSKKLSEKRLELFVLLFLFPSILFWTSGVLKEGMIFFSMGIILYIIDLMIDTKAKPQLYLYLLLAFLLLRYTKFYLFILLLPLLTGYIWNSKTDAKHQLIKYLSILSVFLLGGIIIGVIFPEYNFVHVIIRKQHDFLQMAKAAGSGSLIPLAPLKDSMAGILGSIIPGFIRTFTMPYPWDIRNIMMIIPLLENLLIWIFLVFTLIFFKKPSDKTLFWFSLLFFLLVFSLTGIITPVTGALVRYRIIGIPFFITILLQIWDKEKTIHFLLRD